MTDDDLQAIARTEAKWLIEPDRKQLRFNDIVSVARSHYPSDMRAGVVELVGACDRVRCYDTQDGFKIIDNELYVKGAPMWQTLRDQYAWMVAA